MDTDVEIKMDIEPLIDAGMVCGIQNHRVGTNELDFVSLEGIDSRNGKRATFFCVQSGFLYSEPNHQFVKHCMQVMYDNGNKPFISESGKTNQFVIDWRLMAELSKFGVVYRDKEQWLREIDLHLYDSSVFATRKSKNKGSYLIHWFDQSWKPNTSIRLIITKYIKKQFYWVFRRI